MQEKTGRKDLKPKQGGYKLNIDVLLSTPIKSMAEDLTAIDSLVHFYKSLSDQELVMDQSPLTAVLKEDGDVHQVSDLSLRPLDVSDIDDFMVWATDPKVANFCSWEPYTSKEDGMNYIKNTVQHHPWFKAICINNRPIGAISVTKNSGRDACRGELGYVLAAKYWGKGIATRAVKLVAKTIFQEWPHLERLEALVDIKNLGSQRVLEKAGFQREGVLRKFVIMKGKSRDMIMFSLLSTDPH